MTEAERRDSAQRHAELVRIARGGPNTPRRLTIATRAELVMRDERTNARIELQPYHFKAITFLASHDRVILTAHPESGKTQLGINYALGRLGEDVTQRIVVLSETKHIADRIVGNMLRYIDEPNFSGCKALREIFPHLKPGTGKSDKWNFKEGFFIDRGERAMKDPSIVGAGLDTGILSARVSLLIMDDILTQRSCATPYLRKKVLDFIDGTLDGRMDEDGQVLLLCNAQNEDDAGGVLSARTATWRELKMMVTDDGTATGKPEWPARWSAARIQKFVTGNPTSHQVVLFCRRRKIAEGGRFKAEWIAQAKERGRGLAFPVVNSKALPPGSKVHVGVDFAFTKNDKSDYSAIVVHAVDREFRRTVIDVLFGKWDDDEGLDHLISVVVRFPYCRVRAESNAAQSFIVKAWARGLAKAGGIAAMEPYVTTGAKWSEDFGIPALAASYARGEYILPTNEAGEAPAAILELCDQMLAFDMSARVPGSRKLHTGDILMAHFFAEGLAMDARNFEYTHGFAGDVAPKTYEEQVAHAEADARERQEMAALVSPAFGSFLDDVLADSGASVWAGRR